MGGATSVQQRVERKTGYFNPRSPWGERPQNRLKSRVIGKFQSTLPVGGATPIISPRIYVVNFNPRSPWGERRLARTAPTIHKDISIHAPRGGSDRRPTQCACTASVFQSTLPVGGATLSCGRLPPRCSCHFNPRSPWGERHSRIVSSHIAALISIHAPRGGSDIYFLHILRGMPLFQSTLPVGGATRPPL